MTPRLAMASALSFVALTILLIASGAAASASRSFTPTRKFQVSRVPGYVGNKLPSRHFTGHIPVRGGDHLLWYYLVESEDNALDDPVLLWLTGGPGCSSMDAFVYEHGPFAFTQELSGSSKGGGGDRDGIRVAPNPYSWSKAATVIYVDSPVGSGLSYVRGSDQRDVVHTDDEQTTDDLLEFIVALLTRDFPSLRDKDFFLAGESYAGVYVPLLASKIVAHNERAGPSQRLELLGYAVGNGVTDDVYDGNGQPEFAYNMGLIDPATFAELKALCDNSFWNATPGGECDAGIREAYRRFYWVNPYDILADCFVRDSAAAAGTAGQAQRRSATSRRLQQGGGTRRAGGDGMRLVGGGQQQQQRAAVDAAASEAQAAAAPSSSGIPLLDAAPLHTWRGRVGHSVPCADRRVALAWFNREDVRAALHAPPVADLEWQPCSDHVSYTFASQLSMIPLHQQALDQRLRVLIYSGDHDFVVPFTGTRAWVYGMNLTVDQPYSPWMFQSQDAGLQVAGFRAIFKGGLVFATVKGAGHMVPQTSPDKALSLLRLFLSDSW